MMLKPMLKRLQAALDCEDFTDQMVLAERKVSTGAGRSSKPTVDIIVAYNGSNNSQGALDIALWIAYQTRLVNPHPVLVHVVYVVDKTRPETIANADRILWQARCLASEWRGSLNTHLRIGDIAIELSNIATEIDAEVMLIGCHDADYGLVQELAKQVPCSVLGLPNQS
jgi:hypothetical protein